MAQNTTLKNNPGEWLRWRVMERLFSASVLAMMGVTWLCATAGIWLAQSQTLLLNGWELLMTICPAFIFLFAAGISVRGGRRGWKMRDMRKGARAEARIGHVIEYSITRDSCAVAHNVMGIAKNADIDHLVTTPRGLWVVETKARRHSDSEDAKLNAVAAKVKDVRSWAPQGTKISGCLVYVEDAGPRIDSELQVNGELIRRFSNQQTLMRVLRREAREEGGSKELVGKIWGLSVRLDDGD